MQRRLNLLALYTVVGAVSAALGIWLLVLGSLLATLLLIRLVAEDRARWDNLRVALEVADDHEYRQTLFHRFIAERGVVSHRRPLAERTAFQPTTSTAAGTTSAAGGLTKAGLAAPRA